MYASGRVHTAQQTSLQPVVHSCMDASLPSPTLCCSNPTGRRHSDRRRPAGWRAAHAPAWHRGRGGVVRPDPARRLRAGSVLCQPAVQGCTGAQGKPMCSAAGWFGFGSCRPRLPSGCSRAHSYLIASFRAVRMTAGCACWKRERAHSCSNPSLAAHLIVSSAGHTRCTHSDVVCTRIYLPAGGLPQLRRGQHHLLWRHPDRGG